MTPVNKPTRLDGFLEAHANVTGFVLGVDLSLTSTGLAAVAVDPQGQVEVETGRVKTKLAGHDRLEEIITTVVRSARWADLVVLEGLAFAAHDTDRAGAGLNWLVRHELWRERVPVAICPPATRALYATGKGNAGKDAVLAAVAVRYQHVTTIDQNDVADAMTMAALGSRHLGRTIDGELSAKHLSALAKIQWPAAEVAA